MSETKLGLISITGEGAKKLLQGQLTCNIEEITVENPSLAAHCNPQGRIISLFRIYSKNDHYYLLLPFDMVSIALAALKKYAVFFKVTLTDISNLLFSEDSPIPTPSQNQHTLDIAAGIPAIYADTSEKFLPHELNLQNLNAISFTKGCYTGQEIIARMQYRGKLKNHMYRFTAQSPTPPLRNTPIYNTSANPSGTIVDSVCVGYNTYELLIVVAETEITSPLFMDETKQSQLTLLALPYSL